MSVIGARREAERLANRLGFRSAPIRVDEIAKALGVEIVRTALGEGVSGLLVSDGTRAKICVNDDDLPQRQRFTIAHEIGHHVLKHQFQPGEHVHVDRGYRISERSLRASTGTDLKEIEANQFAAALLMPTQLLRSEATKLSPGALRDADVTRLAKLFNVSEQAMTIRLSSIGLL